MKYKLSNIPIIRQRLGEWNKKHHPTIYCCQETHFRNNYTGRMKENEWKNKCDTNINQKQTGVLY